MKTKIASILATLAIISVSNLPAQEATRPTITKGNIANITEQRKPTCDARSKP